MYYITNILYNIYYISFEKGMLKYCFTFCSMLIINSFISFTKTKLADGKRCVAD